MLKSALDTYPVRDLTWSSPKTVNTENMDDEARDEYFAELDDALINDPSSVGSKIKLPSTFEFSSRVIFISNLPADKIDSAIRSRSLFVDVYLRGTDVIRRIKSILPYIEQDMSDKEKNEILEALSENGGDGLTMRAVTASIGIKSAIDKLGLKTDWKRLSSSYV